MFKSKPFIIAEVGSNWSTFEHAKDSISLAKACGADAVKFQLFTAEALYGMNCIDIRSLPIEWLPKLAEKARAVGIEFMCSAFSPELLEAVDPFVNYHKLASSEMCHTLMLDKLKKFNKPTIISTGAQTQRDILGMLHYVTGLPVTLMYCEASYPSRNVNLDVFYRLKNHVFRDYDWGFSDHTLDVIETPRRAVRMGAICIEKHVNFAGVTSPDSPHSLSTKEFQTMVKALREQLEPEVGPTIDEEPMLLRHKRRVIAISDIKAGDTLRLGQNYGIYRSLKDDVFGAHPHYAKEMDGKTVNCDIKAGDGIAISFVDSHYLKAVHRVMEAQ